jgi:DNA end-binding protein Ku
MKSIWNGSISFGLVNIPVRLYSAVEQHGSKFRMLHSKHHSPIRYKKWCDECQAEVPWDEIVKAVEVGKNKYLILTKEELASIKPARSHSIEVVAFIESGALDPIYVDSHYYVGPETENEKTYFLFKEVLQQSAKVAIGRFVMRDKEYLCSIESYREGILLTTLNYEYEIRDIKGIEELKKGPKLNAAELDLAKQLIERLAEREFSIKDYKDNFADELAKMVKKKESGDIISIEKVKLKITKEENLIEALKASLR